MVSNIVDREGTHVTHCCAKHGCKYGEWQLREGEVCVVAKGLRKQAYPCEFCTSSEELEQQIANLQDELNWSRSLGY